jgi:hypothetical protein
MRPSRASDASAAQSASAVAAVPGAVPGEMSGASLEAGAGRSAGDLAGVVLRGFVGADRGGRRVCLPDHTHAGASEPLHERGDHLLPTPGRPDECLGIPPPTG